MNALRGVAIVAIAAVLAFSTFVVHDLIVLDRPTVDWGWLWHTYANNVSRNTDILLGLWLAALAAGGLAIVHLAGWTGHLRARARLALVLAAGSLTAGLAVFVWARQTPVPYDSAGQVCTLMFAPPDCTLGRWPVRGSMRCSPCHCSSRWYSARSL